MVLNTYYYINIIVIIILINRDIIIYYILNNDKGGILKFILSKFVMENKYGIIHEIGDLGLGFSPISEEEQNIIENNNEEKETKDKDR